MNTSNTQPPAAGAQFSVGELADLANDLDRYAEKNPDCLFIAAMDGARIRWILKQNAALMAALEPFANIGIEHWPKDKKYFDVSLRRDLIEQARAAFAAARA